MPLKKKQSDMVLLKPLFRQPWGMLFMEMYLHFGFRTRMKEGGGSLYFIEVDLQFLLVPMGLIDILKRCLGDNTKY